MWWVSGLVGSAGVVIWTVPRLYCKFFFEVGFCLTSSDTKLSVRILPLSFVPCLVPFILLS